VHRRAILNAEKQPRTSHHMCQDIENTHAPEKDSLRWKGNAHAATHRTPPSPGPCHISCRRQSGGQLSAPDLLEKLALHVAQSLRGHQGHLGAGTIHMTQEPSNANPGTRRTGRRVPAPGVAPQRYRRRRRHHAGARPARKRASALTTHYVPYATPLSHGGESTRVARIHAGVTWRDRLDHRAPVVNGSRVRLLTRA